MVTGLIKHGMSRPSAIINNNNNLAQAAYPKAFFSIIISHLSISFYGWFSPLMFLHNLYFFGT